MGYNPERLLFGLESMRDKMGCLLLDCDDSDDYERCTALKEECESLIDKFRGRGVTKKEYERIVEITLDRENMRYEKCLESGVPYDIAVAALRGE